MLKRLEGGGGGGGNGLISYNILGAMESTNVNYIKYVKSTLTTNSKVLIIPGISIAIQLIKQ